jgi:alpha-methylacyl-CoA racemase
MMPGGAAGQPPLTGVTVVELAGAGPVAFAATMLAELGARVVRIDRPGPPVSLYPRDPALDVLGRGRESIVLDLKGGGLEVALRLVEQADVFVEGLRPGAAERLGIGPEPCLERNPGLVYGRVSGWGRTGPLAARPGHDIDFIAVGGALAHVVGRDGRPAIPLSLLGDFGGGGMCLALGVTSALLTARATGRGHVVDTSLLDAVAALMAPLWGIRADGEFDDELPGANVADGGSPFYNVYRCADGRYLAVGAIEDRFRSRLAELLGTEAVLGADRARWPAERAELDLLFATRAQAEWCALLEDEDVCVSPVLSLGESRHHRQFAARDRFVDAAGVTQPRPAWTIDGAPLEPPPPAPPRGLDGPALLSELGYPATAISQLSWSGAVGGAEK